MKQSGHDLRKQRIVNEIRRNCISPVRIPLNTKVSIENGRIKPTSTTTGHRSSRPNSQTDSGRCNRTTSAPTANPRPMAKRIAVPHSGAWLRSSAASRSAVNFVTAVWIAFPSVPCNRVRKLPACPTNAIPAGPRKMAVTLMLTKPTAKRTTA